MNGCQSPISESERKVNKQRKKKKKKKERKKERKKDQKKGKKKRQARAWTVVAFLFFKIKKGKK